MLVYPTLITKLTTNYDDFIHVKLLFIVLSLVAALLLPIKRLIIEVKGLPTHRDSTTLHSGVTVMISFKITPPSPSNQSTPMRTLAENQESKRSKETSFTLSDNKAIGTIVFNTEMNCDTLEFSIRQLDCCASMVTGGDNQTCLAIVVST